MIRYGLAIWLLSSAIGLHSQIEVLAALDKDSLVIGDTVTMQVTVNADPGVEVVGVFGYFLDGFVEGYNILVIYSSGAHLIIDRKNTLQINGGCRYFFQ